MCGVSAAVGFHLKAGPLLLFFLCLAIVLDMFVCNCDPLLLPKIKERWR